MNRPGRSTSLLVSATLLVAACSGGGEEAVPESTTTSVVTTTVAPTTVPTTTTTTVPVTTTTVPSVLRMPLTGQPVADQSEIPDRPALVVKISNAPQSVLPQAGLNQADIVFEEIINDQSTRLAAVFHSQESDPVGPIRSGRAQDINLLLSLNRPLLAWSGGNRTVTRAIEDSDLIDLSAQHTSGYYRRSGRSAPNDLYSSTDALRGHTPDDAAPPMSVFTYLDPGQELTGETANEIQLQLDSMRVIWRYDEESGGYFRFQNGDQHHTETATGVERVWAANLVVMVADYGVNPFDGNPDAQVLGSNPVYVFTGGTIRAGIWLRFAAQDPFGLYDNVDDLNPIGLSPGRTWVEIPRNVDGTLFWSE